MFNWFVYHLFKGRKTEFTPLWLKMVTLGMFYLRHQSSAIRSGKLLINTMWSIKKINIYLLYLSQISILWLIEAWPYIRLPHDPGALLFQINMYRALFEFILITRHVLVFSGCWWHLGSLLYLRLYLC